MPPGETDAAAGLNEQQLLDLAGGLLAGWDAPIDMSGDTAKQPEATLVVYGLAAHVHRLARAYLVLYRQGLVLEAAPLLRSAFEAALTCAWANEMPDALPAIENEDHRRWTALVAQLTGPRWPVDAATRARWNAVVRALRVPESLVLTNEARLRAPSPGPRPRRPSNRTV